MSDKIIIIKIKKPVKQNRQNCVSTFIRDKYVEDSTYWHGISRIKKLLFKSIGK